MEPDSEGRQGQNQKEGEMILYLRHERTDDHIALSQLDEEFITSHPDVVAYRDEACTDFIGRWPWYYNSKPTRMIEAVMLNCVRWEVKWIEQELVAG